MQDKNKMLLLSLLWWMLRNPGWLLGIWVAGWSTLLIKIAESSGWVQSLQVGLAGLGNLSSPVGIAIPMALLALMSINRIIPWMLKNVVKLALTMWRLIQKEMLHGAANIHKAMKKVKGALPPRSAYVGGLTEEGDEAPPDLHAALGELFGALEASGYSEAYAAEDSS